MKLIAMLFAALLAWTATATDGTHTEKADMDGFLDDIKALVATPQVVEREVQVVREVEVIREVEVAPEVSESLGFGLSGGTAGGCDLPDMYLAYSRVTDGLAVAGRVKQGGNRACKSATSADISIERDFGRISIELGYDLRGVSFSGPSNEGEGDAIFYGSMSAASAIVNYEFDVGALNIETGYNIPGQAPRVAASWSNEAETLAAEFDSTMYSGGLFTSLKASWNRSFGDEWGMEAFASYSLGTDNVDDPIVWKSDQELTPLDPPTSTYSYGVGVTRSL